MPNNRVTPKKFILFTCLSGVGVCWLVTSLLIAGFLLVALTYSEDFIYNQSVTPIVTSRIIVGNSLPVFEKWRLKKLIPSTDLPQMHAISNHLVVEGRSNGLLKSTVQVFNTQNGGLEWEISDLPMIYIIVTDPDRVYLAIQYQLRAYDLNSGILSWESEQIPTNKIYHMDIENGKVILYSVEDKWGSREQVVRVVDAKNGKILETKRFQVQDDLRLLCDSPTNNYWIGSEIIQAERKSDNKVVWQARVKSPGVGCLPTLQGLVIGISGYGFTNIYAVDALSGYIVWIYSEKIISNVTQVGEILYAIRDDGDLVGIDLYSGKEIGSVIFSQKRNPDGGISEAYVISSYDNSLYAYWGDSQEIIAFGVQELIK